MEHQNSLTQRLDVALSSGHQHLRRWARLLDKTIYLGINPYEAFDGDPVSVSGLLGPSLARSFANDLTAHRADLESLVTDGVEITRELNSAIEALHDDASNHGTKAAQSATKDANGLVREITITAYVATAASRIARTFADGLIAPCVPEALEDSEAHLQAELDHPQRDVPGSDLLRQRQKELLAYARTATVANFDEPTSEVTDFRRIFELFGGA